MMIGLECLIEEIAIDLSIFRGYFFFLNEKFRYLFDPRGERVKKAV